MYAEKYTLLALLPNPAQFHSHLVNESPASPQSSSIKVIYPGDEIYCICHKLKIRKLIYSYSLGARGIEKGC